jgi:hypothetical protein
MALLRASGERVGMDTGSIGQRSTRVHPSSPGPRGDRVTVTAVGFFIAALIAMAILVWWVRRGRGVVADRVLLNVRRAMQDSSGWRSGSIFASGKYHDETEQRRLVSRGWYLLLIMWVLIAVFMVVAGIVSLN